MLFTCAKLVCQRHPPPEDKFALPGPDFLKFADNIHPIYPSLDLTTIYPAHKTAVVFGAAGWNLSLLASDKGSIYQKYGLMARADTHIPVI